MTPQQRICQQLDELDEEGLGVAERVIDALVAFHHAKRLGDPPRDPPTDLVHAHDDFDLEEAIDFTFADDPTTVPRRTFVPGNDVEVDLPEPLGVRIGIFVGIDPSGMYRINLGGGITKAFPPEQVRRKSR